MIAIDTNIFIRAVQTFDLKSRILARTALKSLYVQGERLVCFPQNLVEFWNVSTRPPQANGLGFTPDQAARYIDRLQKIVRLLPEDSQIFPVWRRLVFEYRVSGIQVHDARIVAAMEIHGVNRILTFDGTDFKRYGHITVVDPRSLSATDTTTPANDR